MPGIDFHQSPGLVGQHLLELVPSDIEDTSVSAAVLSNVATRGIERAPVGPGHVPGLEILDHDGAVGSRDEGGHAMRPVFPNTGDLRLHPGQVSDRATIPVAALLAPADPALEKPGPLIELRQSFLHV